MVVGNEPPQLDFVSWNVLYRIWSRAGDLRDKILSEVKFLNHSKEIDTTLRSISDDFMEVEYSLNLLVWNSADYLYEESFSLELHAVIERLSKYMRKIDKHMNGGSQGKAHVYIFEKLNELKNQVIDLLERLKHRTDI